MSAGVGFDGMGIDGDYPRYHGQAWIMAGVARVLLECYPDVAVMC